MVGGLPRRTALERGPENPTVIVLDRLASALDVTVADFFAAVSPSEKLPRPLPGEGIHKNSFYPSDSGRSRVGLFFQEDRLGIVPRKADVCKMPF